MKLIRSESNGCVAASVAMLFDWDLKALAAFPQFDTKRCTYPFPYPWDKLPKVSSMVEICEWAFRFAGCGLTPFPRNPVCTPDEDCSPVPVYENGEPQFLTHLAFGAGLLEGSVEGRGHMCAWDGLRVWDPRGHIYQIEDAPEYTFKPARFWLKVEGR